MNDVVTRVLDGEILTPGTNYYRVSYWRNFHQTWDENETIEDCLSYLHHCSASGLLSHLGSTITNMDGTLVMDEQQVQDRLDTWEEDDD